MTLKITTLGVMALATGAVTGLTANTLPGLVIFGWTPVWAAYALWQHLLRRQSTKLPSSTQFDQELKDLLEKEGKK